MFENHVQWRAEISHDNILHKDTSYIDNWKENYFPRFYSGIDKFGRPVMIEPYGKYVIPNLEVNFLNNY